MVTVHSTIFRTHGGRIERASSGLYIQVTNCPLRPGIFSLRTIPASRHRPIESWIRLESRTSIAPLAARLSIAPFGSSRAKSSRFGSASAYWRTATSTAHRSHRPCRDAARIASPCPANRFTTSRESHRRANRIAARIAPPRRVNRIAARIASPAASRARSGCLRTRTLSLRARHRQ